MCLDGAAEIPAEAERLDQPEVVFSVSVAACASIRQTYKALTPRPQDI